MRILVSCKRADHYAIPSSTVGWRIFARTTHVALHLSCLKLRPCVINGEEPRYTGGMYAMACKKATGDTKSRHVLEHKKMKVKLLPKLGPFGGPQMASHSNHYISHPATCCRQTVSKHQTNEAWSVPHQGLHFHVAMLRICKASLMT